MEKIIVKSSKRFNVSTVIAAVDVGSRTNMGYCRSQGKEIKPFGFKNNREGFDMFLCRIEQFKRMHNLDEIVVGIESTGCYGIPLLNYLKDKPMKLVQVNPMHTKRMKSLTDNSPNKTDEKDPRVIADVIELGNYLTVSVPEGVPAELRNSMHNRERLMQRRTEYYNHLHALEFQIFPEFVEIVDMRTKTAKYILKEMTIPFQIVVYRRENFIKKIREISRGSFRKEKAELLYESAKKSVGITEGIKSIVDEIRSIILQIDTIDNDISQLEQKITLLIKEVPYSSHLLSMKGVGEIIVAGLIGEIGDFAKFSTEDELLKYAGLNIFECSSGKHKGQRHITKVGRPLLRKLLFFAALNTVRKGGIMHGVYAAHCDRGMKKIKALVAVMRKLLRIMHSLVKKQSYYQENYIALQVAA